MVSKFNKKAFSMVELLLLLLFVSLITAALTPVVTRKHFKIPKPAGHGAYFCYYKLIYDTGGNIIGKKLHETRFSGRALNTVIFDRDVTSCTFEPPQKVSYFHVSAIGGGGGGGDSGYNGGSYNTLGPYIEQLSPLGITKVMIDESQRDITEQDLSDYGGQLYGYIHGAASGRGGDQNFTKRSDSRPCTSSHVEHFTEVKTKTTCVKTETVDECPPDGCSSGTGTVTTTTPGNSDPSKPWKPPAPPECGPSSTRCIRYEKQCKTVTKHGGLAPNGANIGCGNAGECGQNGGSIFFEYQDEECNDVCAEEETVPGACSSSFNTPDSKMKLKLPNFKYYNPNIKIAYINPKKALLFVKDNLLSYTHCIQTTSSSYSSPATKTVCDKTQNYYSYSISGFKGGDGAPGATCRSSYTNGQLNLLLKADTTDLPIPANASNGKSCFNAISYPSEYDSPSYGVKECSPCATNGARVLGGSSIIFNGQQVTAQNAQSGGTAASCEVDGSPGIAGSTCTGGEPVTEEENCSPGRYGYCLKRHGRTTWEPNANYEFKFTFSQNYLQYGEAGLQGQYRTMIIRSFKEKNLPITIGVGGAAGVDGGQGGTGSETVFGDIIRAKGGEGGQGGFLTPPELLEGYRTGAETWAAGEINESYVPNKRIVRQEGGKNPEKPKPDNLSSNILNFFVPQDNEKVTKIMDDNLIGYGGKGGGSQHNCWFGEYRKWLDEYNGKGELEHSWPNPPDACKNNYEKIDALPGGDGALIIRW